MQSPKTRANERVVVLGHSPDAEQLDRALGELSCDAVHIERTESLRLMGKNYGTVVVFVNSKRIGWRALLADVVRASEGHPVIAVISDFPVEALLCSLEIGVSAVIDEKAGCEVLAMQVVRLNDLIEKREVRLESSSTPELDRSESHLASASIDGKRVRLSGDESRLVTTLVNRQGRVVSYEDLICAIGIPAGGRTQPKRLLSVKISRLRRKLGRNASDLIRSISGTGYMLCMPQAMEIN
jgi:DNA-binding response OmpR family regulator